jgi:hypothetical protein
MGVLPLSDLQARAVICFQRFNGAFQKSTARAGQIAIISSKTACAAGRKDLEE